MNKQRFHRAKRSFLLLSILEIPSFEISRSIPCVWEGTHIIGADQPTHLCKGRQLTIHKTLDLALAPAIVDMTDRHHVPLKIQG